MNDTFNFSRFITYFKYDLRQMWRNHSKAAIFLCGAGLILYVIWVILSLLFTQSWTSPEFGARVGVFFLAFFILALFQTRTYGHLTDRKAGASWLMVPASRTEKFVSMLLITLIIIPVFFISVFSLLDGLFGLLDPTYGETFLSAGITGVYSERIGNIGSIGSKPLTEVIDFTPGAIAVGCMADICAGYLYFLLCGISFKRHKTVNALLILIGLSILIPMVLGLVAFAFSNGNFDIELDDEQAMHWLAGILNAFVVLKYLVAAGLGWGIWHRIKSLQH